MSSYAAKQLEHFRLPMSGVVYRVGGRVLWVMNGQKHRGTVTRIVRNGPKGVMPCLHIDGDKGGGFLLMPPNVFPLEG